MTHHAPPRPATATEQPGDRLRYDAIILAGGRARRLGTSKPGFVIVGRTLLDYALDATCQADRTVVVGPEELTGRAYLRTREDPPFGGPVAGIGAGLTALDDAERDRPAPSWVLLLACDIPRAAEVVPSLANVARTANENIEAVYPVHNGRAQWLAGLYRRRALAEGLRAIGDPHGAAIRRLITAMTAITVNDDGDLTFDVDTWQDATVHEQRAQHLHGSEE